MRKYNPKGDKSKQNYYKDRFFVNKSTAKFGVLGTKFEGEIERLAKFGVEILNSYVEFDNLVVYIKKNDNLKALKIFKDLGYEILCELSGVDLTEKQNGIEVFYQILNTNEAKRARIKCLVENKTFLQSVSEIYKSANWAERELYDMMGVWIENHPNLARILMPDDWHGHPLLKSYPLQGDEFAHWYEIDKIFGKARRDEFGEENRNSSFIDSKDTFNFSRIYHECEFGGEIPNDAISQEYQEKDGVPFVKELKKDKFKLIKKRK
ncbi:MAG: NADH-quinone oxidoreductase subunit C [Campylobacter sp.]|nr:NADH-quinone oxidoreductase subunit C [Campylobacter sp.]